MNDAASNKMFKPAYRAKWPTAVQALAHLEKCSERVALLQADGLAADDPRLVAAVAEAKRASADYSRAEKADEAMRFQSVGFQESNKAVGREAIKEGAVAGVHSLPLKEETCIGRFDPAGRVKCLCGLWLSPDIDRCPGCNSKRRAG